MVYEIIFVGFQQLIVKNGFLGVAGIAGVFGFTRPPDVPGKASVRNQLSVVVFIGDLRFPVIVTVFPLRLSSAFR
jgi:hypothetical protein